jgi:hypothetical protein
VSWEGFAGLLLGALLLLLARHNCMEHRPAAYIYKDVPHMLLRALPAPFLLLLPPLPLLSCSVAAGLVLGALMLLVVRPPAGLRKHVMVATALGNAGNLPLVLVAALIRETGGRLFGGEVSQQLLLWCCCEGGSTFRGTWQQQAQARLMQGCLSEGLSQQQQQQQVMLSAAARQCNPRDMGGRVASKSLC